MSYGRSPAVGQRRGLLVDLNEHSWFDLVEHCDHVGIAHSNATVRTRVAEQFSIWRSVDVDVPREGVDLPASILPFFDPIQPDHTREDPITVRVRSLQLCRADLTGRTPAYEDRTEWSPLSDQLPHFVPATGRLLATHPFACAFGGGRHRIGCYNLVALEQLEHLSGDLDSNPALLHQITIPIARGAAQQGAAADRPPPLGLPGRPAAGRGRGSVGDSDGLERGRRSFLGTLAGGRQLSAGPLRRERCAVEIRAFQEADQEKVVALWRAVFPTAPAHNDPVLDIRRKRSVQPDLFLVALQGPAVIGTCMAGFDGHRGWVHLVAVAPEHRRRGVGSGLMRRAEALLAALGCPKLNLQVRSSSPESIPFYERLGFQVEERISMGKVLVP